jgi:AcrR family transcriptional regulator
VRVSSSLRRHCSQSAGFYGTATRDIASAVGVRQPTLYSHFATKQAILAALIDADILQALDRIERVLALPGPVAPRLHAYLRIDVAAIMALPFDVRGLYNDEALKEPELADQAARRNRLHTLTRTLVQDGVDNGEFVADSGFVQHAITGLLLEVIRERGLHDTEMTPADRPDTLADFVLRAILAEPQDLPEVRARSARLSARLLAGPEPSAVPDGRTAT